MTVGRNKKGERGMIITGKTKKLITTLIILATFCLPATVFAVNTYGTLNGNVTWRGEINIVGDVLVDSDAVLTIMPGTVIKFVAGSNVAPLLPSLYPGEDFTPEDLIGNWLIVKGQLIAEGTSSNMITFTSNSTSPAPGDWACILFTEISGDSSIKNCIIEYGGDSINTSGEGNTDYSVSVQNWKRRFRNQPKSSVKNHPPGDVDAPVRHRC
jgi:hypothetical protein